MARRREAPELTMVTAVSKTVAKAVRRHPIWREAEEHVVLALASHARDLSLAPGQLVLRAGEPATTVYLLIEGAVRVYYPADGRRGEMTVKLFGAPATFGDDECTLQGTWSESVEALIATRVLAVDARRYFRLLQRSPSACFRQYWDVARRFALAIRFERSATSTGAVERVGAVLLAYASQFGVPHVKGTLIDFPLTQEEIGRQSSSKRRSVVRALAELYESGVLVRVGRRYCVRSVEKLLARAVPTVSLTTDEEPWAEL